MTSYTNNNNNNMNMNNRNTHNCYSNIDTEYYSNYNVWLSYCNSINTINQSIDKILNIYNNQLQTLNASNNLYYTSVQSYNAIEKRNHEIEIEQAYWREQSLKRELYECEQELYKTGLDYKIAIECIRNYERDIEEYHHELDQYYYDERQREEERLEEERIEEERAEEERIEEERVEEERLLREEEYINTLIENNITKELFYNIENPQNNSCPITQEEFGEDDEVGIIKHCNHIFHYSPLISWIREHFVCPMCRHDIRGISNELLTQDEIMDRIRNFLHGSSESTSRTQSLVIRYSRPVQRD